MWLIVFLDTPKSLHWINVHRLVGSFPIGEDGNHEEINGLDFDYGTHLKPYFQRMMRLDTSNVQSHPPTWRLDTALWSKSKWKQNPMTTCEAQWHRSRQHGWHGRAPIVEWWKIQAPSMIWQIIIGKTVVPFGWYPSCLTLQGAVQKGIYPTNTHYIRCIWGWLLRVPSQGYHHFPYEIRILGGFPYNHQHLRWPTGGKRFCFSLPRSMDLVKRFRDFLVGDFNQPLWNICSSRWVHLPQFSGWK